MKINVNDFKPNEVLKFIRENSGLTQQEFANMFSKSKAWVVANEAGKTRFYFEDFANICKNLNLDLTITDIKEKK